MSSWVNVTELTLCAPWLQHAQSEIKKLLTDNEQLRMSYLQLHNQKENGEPGSMTRRVWQKREANHILCVNFLLTMQTYARG